MRVSCVLSLLLREEKPLLSVIFLFALASFVFLKNKKKGSGVAVATATASVSDRHVSQPPQQNDPVEDQRDQHHQQQQRVMVEETEHNTSDGNVAAMPVEDWLSRARLLVPTALEKARSARGFAGRWKSIASKIERVPTCLSDLSTHPCFARHALCRELLESVAATLSEAVELADRCCGGDGGKLRMQSDLDALSGKLDLNLRDCGLLVKTGVLGEAGPPPASTPARPGEAEFSRSKLCELLARLQIGHAEAKHRALDGLLEAMREDGKSVMAVLCRSNVSALVHLLTASSPKVREKAATAVFSLTESENCGNLLVSEGVLPPLIRLLESGSLVAREKAVISLERLSISADTARSIAGHGGILPLIEVCQVGDSTSQSAAAGALKNLSAVPEVRQSLADEGVVRVMINLLDCSVVSGSKAHAAECLQQLTSSNESLRRWVVSEGGVRSLLAYIDGPSPQEAAVGALKNLVCSAPMDRLISLGLLPRLVHALKDGSLGAQQAAAAAICKITSSAEAKRTVGESGCTPLLVKMLEAKSNGAREAAAQAMASLMTHPHNAREAKKEEKGVANLVRLLDPTPQNTAKKYAVACLLILSSSKRCKKMMVSHGGIGYLKKLAELDVPGARKLLDRLQRGRLRSLLFARR
ncbi:hypothetical protein C4D60_Mb07t22690 [Musa balbisiana]|uniref:DUF7032 domain-containing protein n=1 Tax=Musa balbisiana TaxID=52838 RepID=A0A4S8JJS0_MUSBA|nr:hypothetical protein C4D60_Mb07t22690 [Musa balbisiana]